MQYLWNCGGPTPIPNIVCEDDGGNKGGEFARTMEATRMGRERERWSERGWGGSEGDGGRGVSEEDGGNKGGEFVRVGRE